MGRGGLHVDAQPLRLVSATSIPLASEFAGLASGAWYAWEGDWVGAGSAVAGVVPVIGVGADVGRLAKASDAGKAVVQRWMSRAELEATRSTGLLRGGRAGTHYVTDAANADPTRARLRLALPKTPEVRVTMEVPRDVLSAPSRVEPAFDAPGGGLERTAVGDVPIRILGVD